MNIHHGLCIYDPQLVEKEDRSTVHDVARARKKSLCYDSHKLKLERKIKPNEPNFHKTRTPLFPGHT